MIGRLLGKFGPWIGLLLDKLGPRYKAVAAFATAFIATLATGSDWKTALVVGVAAALGVHVTPNRSATKRPDDPAPDHGGVIPDVIDVVPDVIHDVVGGKHAKPDAS